MSSLKSKAISGVAWNTIERFSVQGIQFIIQIILARILTPEDYGVVAMLAIFLAVSQSIIDSGFTSALVQKIDRTEVDYATVFYFNIGISVILFFILFFSAPLIAEFYKTPILSSVTKVVAINLIINAFSIVPKAKFTVLIDFKSQAKVAIVAIIISGAVGIWMASIGFGVWALVFQSLLNNVLNSILLWILSRWFPLRIFSFDSFKKLFFFGSKLLISGLIDTIFRNIYTLVIGRKFSTQEVGYYSRADQFAQFPSANMTNIIWKVAMTVMCKEQNNEIVLKSIFRKFLRLSAYIVFPLMIGFAVLAEPLIVLILTEKWLSSVRFLQILCLAYVWYPIHVINLSILQAKGRSDIFLWIEILKKIMCIIVLIFTLSFGIMAICIGIAATSFLSLFINLYYTKKIIGIGHWQQFREIIPSVLMSFVMGGLVYLFTKIGFTNLITLLGGFFIGVISYILGSIFFKLKAWNEMYELSFVYIKKLLYKR